MPRIDWEWSPYKNPFGEDTPGGILARKWKNLILYEGGWLRSYLLTILSILYLIGIAVWWRGDQTAGGWSGHSLLQQLAVTFLIPLFLLNRIYLASVPGLIVHSDARRSPWKHYRERGIGGDEVAKAMLAHAFTYGALPFAFVSTFETVFYMWAVSAEMVAGALLLRSPVVFVIFLALGLMLTAFGLLAALLWRHALAVVGAVVLPFVLVALVAGPGFIGGFLGSIATSSGVQNPGSLGTHLAVLLLAPENRLAFLEAAPPAQGVIPYVTDLVQMLGTVIVPAIIAGFMWMSLWTVLRKCLGAG